MNEFLDIA